MNAKKLVGRGSGDTELRASGSTTTGLAAVPGGAGAAAPTALTKAAAPAFVSGIGGSAPIWFDKGEIVGSAFGASASLGFFVPPERPPLDFLGPWPPLPLSAI